MIRTSAYIVCVAIILVCGLGINGQDSAKPATGANQTWTRVDPFGGVTLPRGFRLSRFRGTVDAWFRTIESEDGKLVINFAAGMVGSDEPEDKKGLLWERYVEKEQLQSDKPIQLRIVLYKPKNKKQMIYGSVLWARFSAQVRSIEEQESFVAIVSSYRALPTSSTKQP